MAVYLIRTLRRENFSDIASVFGLRGYSSVGSILAQMKKNLASDPELGARCNAIRQAVSIGHQET